MAGVLRLDYRHLTLRKLLIMHDAHMLSVWDIATSHNTQLYSLCCIVSNFAAGFAKNGKVQHPKTFDQLHPFRSEKEKGKSRQRITKENIHVLRHVFAPS